MDRNQVIGLVLIGVIMFVWFWVAQPDDQNTSTSTTTEQSIATDKVTTSSEKNPEKGASPKAQLIATKDSLIDIETSTHVFTFNLKGGALVKTTLLGFYQTKDTNKNVFFDFNTKWYQAKNISNDDLVFQIISDKQDGEQREITLEASYEGKNIQHIYQLNNKEKQLKWKIRSDDFGAFFESGTIPIFYAANLYPAESTLTYEQQMSNISYNTFENEYDYIKITNEMEETVEEPLKWLSYKQRFFNASFISTDGLMKQVSIKGSSQVNSFDIPSAKLISTFNVVLPSDQKEANFVFYIADNTYRELVALPYENMNEIVDYGSGIFSFVKYINRGIILPFFTWMASYVAQIGWVIALLTIFIRLVTSPLVYSSYLSSAKMRALRPELTALKEKVGDDKQKYSLEQMNLFRQAGVNPLGGCIPALLQIPIFFALYSFFNSHIQLRGEAFWWANDLSTYDSIVALPFSIPFYGDHVSLFNLTATITSFLISIFGMSMNTSPEMQSNPAFKYMPYIFPFFLLFIFNSMPAALTWYYTISNLITLGLQIVINNFIIDHDKILKKIEENKKKSKNKPSIQERLEKFQKIRETQKTKK